MPWGAPGAARDAPDHPRGHPGVWEVYPDDISRYKSRESKNKTVKTKTKQFHSSTLVRSPPAPHRCPIFRRWGAVAGVGDLAKVLEWNCFVFVLTVLFLLSLELYREISSG